MNCVGYLRCSGVSQIDGDTFSRQDAAIVKWCEQTGRRYIACYVEYGMTGDSDLGQRDALGAMWVDLDYKNPNRSWDCPKEIVIEHPDRMARGMFAACAIHKDMMEVKASVFSARDSKLWTIDMNDPEAVLWWGVNTVFAQVEKMKQRARMNAAKGRIRLFGRKNDPDNKRVDGDSVFGEPVAKVKGSPMKAMERYAREQEILAKIESMRFTHKLGPVEIARRLNHANILTRYNKRWTYQQISILVKRILARRKMEKQRREAA